MLYRRRIERNRRIVERNRRIVEKKGKCEIRMKRDKNGRIIGKSLSGECSKAQLEALGFGKIEEHENNEE